MAYTILMVFSIQSQDELSSETVNIRGWWGYNEEITSLSKNYLRYVLVYITLPLTSGYEYFCTNWKQTSQSQPTQSYGLNNH